MPWTPIGTINKNWNWPQNPQHRILSNDLLGPRGCCAIDSKNFGQGIINVHISGMSIYHFYGLNISIRSSFRPLVCYKASLMTLYRLNPFRLVFLKNAKSFHFETGIFILFNRTIFDGFIVILAKTWLLLQGVSPLRLQSKS